MTSESFLDLKMTDKEYRAIGIRIREEEGLDPRDYIDIPYETIEETVISKVAWAIHGWMIDQGFYDPSIDGNPAILLRHILQVKGITKIASKEE